MSLLRGPDGNTVHYKANLPATKVAIATAAAGAALELTIPAPSNGLRIYLTRLQVRKLYISTGTPAAGGAIVSSTNLHDLSWVTEQAAGAQGTVVKVLDEELSHPLPAQAAGAVTITSPAQAQSLYQAIAYYYEAE